MSFSSLSSIHWKDTKLLRIFCMLIIKHDMISLNLTACQVSLIGLKSCGQCKASLTLRLALMHVLLDMRPKLAHAHVLC